MRAQRVKGPPSPHVGRRFVLTGIALSLGAMVVLLFVLGLGAFVGLSDTLPGLFVDVALVGLFVLGLALVALGSWHHRRAHPGEAAQWVIDWSQRHVRIRATALAAVALLSLFAVVGAAQQGVAYMDTTRFCAESCHEVMAPEAEPHRLSAHAHVPCGDCHIGPGFRGYVESKIRGAQETWHFARKDYARPLLDTNQDSVPDPKACIRCHDADRAYGTVTRTFPNFQADEKNTASPITLQVHTGSPEGRIHNHISRDIRYFTTDGGKTFQRVQVTRRDGTHAEFAARSAAPGSGSGGVWRKMDCTTCHNRVGHDVLSFEQRVDQALQVGELPADDPGLKKRLMDAAGATDEVPTPQQYQEALRKLAGVVSSDPRLAAAKGGREIPRFYAASVFPAMRAGPKTYVNYLGHDGCFRCHGALEPVGQQPIAAPQNAVCTQCHSLPGG
jgi:nitrate/TMAO reductase-like tetraheme cytochrome c subunit